MQENEVKPEIEVTEPDRSKLSGPYIIEQKTTRKSDQKILDWTAQSVTTSKLAKIQIRGCDGPTLYKFKKRFTPIILELEDVEIFLSLTKVNAKSL